MTAIDIQKTYDRLRESLFDRQLCVGIKQLRQWASSNDLLDDISDLDDVERTYRSLLDYFGIVDDPQRDSICDRLLIKSLEIAERLRRLLMERYSEDYYYQQVRIKQRSSLLNLQRCEFELSESINQMLLVTEGCLLDSLEIRTTYESALSNLFVALWLGREAENGSVLRAFPAKAFPVEVHRHVISASLLSLMESFSSLRFRLLMDYCLHADQAVSQPALVSLLLGLYMHQRYISLDGKLRGGVSLLFDKPEVRSQLTPILLQLLQGRETEKVTKRMTEEILPEVMKLSTQMRDKLGLRDDTDEPDMPDWQDVVGKSNFSRKLQEYGKLQMEGADLNVLSFMPFKDKPFFRTVANWFLPFDERHSLILQFKNQLPATITPLLSVFKHSDQLCNSDKYSFCLSLIDIPKSMQEAFASQLIGESEELLNQMDTIPDADKKLKPEQYSLFFIRDLYRFVKLFPYKEVFKDLFAAKLDLYAIPEIKNGLLEEELHQIADFLIDKEYYDEALALYEEISRSDPSRNLHKIGFCFQKLGQLERAVKEYQKAEFLRPTDKWIIKQLAICFRELGDVEEALRYYHQLESYEPDNISVNRFLGQLYFQKENYEKALNYFFKIEFISEKTMRAKRSVAWTLFMMKQYDRAIAYYNEIRALEADYRDCINIGHIYWIKGEVCQARDAYLQAMELANGVDHFTKEFYADKSLLLKFGVKATDYALMIEKILHA